MDGITILNTYEEFIPNGVMMLFLILAVIISVALLVFILEDGASLRMLLAAGMVVTFIIFCIISLATPYPFAGETITYYQITIDDSVKYTDFTNKYKIISQNGAIFNVIEKTEESN